MSVRPATARDVQAWLVLRQELWPECPPQQHRHEIEEQLASPNTNAAYVYEDDQGQFLGLVEVSLRKWAEACLSSPVGYLEGWYVCPSARGRGIGAQLVQFAESWARARGCTEMASDTDLHNADSEAAHRRLGYDVAARVICFRKQLDERGG